MRNAAPTFENDLLMVSLHRAQKEKQKLYSVNLRATPEILKIVGKMEQNPLLRELMEKVSSKELTAVYAAGMTKVNSKHGSPSPTQPLKGAKRVGPQQHCST